MAFIGDKSHVARGKKAEMAVRSFLAQCGIKAYPAPYRAPWDLIVGDSVRMFGHRHIVGNRVVTLDVKVSSPERPGGDFHWYFSTDIRDKSVQPPDFFVLRLEGIPGHAERAIHLIVPQATVRVQRLGISMLSLIRGDWAPYYNNVKQITDLLSQRCA